ncbi:MAG: hypothetical protein OHK0057_14760 [Thermoflexibacter sp.]|uniref:Uncharacterized protein n=1 Tax=Thermoflexibacter ruber TaxID=1003 RepID=A0A1I2GLQ4_9BACT|nr:hypothetical protein [Thermoflexibacter ruber]SFF17949.1 hypothetical protein SAMN04488541_10193 [Thermoflexibacter ruber]
MKKLYFMFVLALLLGCGNNNASTEEVNDKVTTEETPPTSQVSEDIISEILDAIPSPLEISFLIKEVGTKYNSANLNNPDFVSNYNTSYQQALNLGAYATDLGYANLYGRNQDVLSFLNCVKKLADNLSIGQFFDYETIKQLASNSGNIDALLQLTQQNFEKINYHLREKKQEYLSILILTGGWVEAIYLTSLVHQDTKNVKLKEKIGEQKIVLEQILVVLEIYKTKANFSTLINDLKELQKIYSGVEMKTVMGKTKTIERNGELVVETDTQTIVNISDTDVEKITSLVKSIRNKIVK